MADDVTQLDCAPKVTKTLLKTAARYLDRLNGGERILRDAAGVLQWASGRPVGPKTVRYMLRTGQIHELDTDLFGVYAFGQTIGIDEPAPHADVAPIAQAAA